VLLSTPPLFNPNFGGVPVAPDRPCWASARAEALSYSPWNYFRGIPTYVLLIPKRHRRTDGRLTVDSPRSALASRGKNRLGLDQETLNVWHTLDYIPKRSQARDSKFGPRLPLGLRVTGLIIMFLKGL